MNDKYEVGILVVGAGLAGIATAYYLLTRHARKSVLLVDCRPPMSFTTAQSGDNYRNWWPHPTMTEFVDHSIDLMEDIANETGNVIAMTRRGYLLATRRGDIDDLVTGLRIGHRGDDAHPLRHHEHASASAYEPPDTDDWTLAPAGVDVLSGGELIRRHYPALSGELTHIVHIRRAGDIDGQRLGRFMLDRIRDAGGRRLAGEVVGVETGPRFRVNIDAAGNERVIEADVFVNAAGPFAKRVAAMIGVDLPMDNVYQQKISFDDACAAIPRGMPFSVDLDEFELGWTDEERELLEDDADRAWLTQRLPGGVHCRPDGGAGGSRIKLGWAFNRTLSEPLEDPANEPRIDAQFPEIVLRAASRLHPGLGIYVEGLPARINHYGGYYPMTHENWPLIGPLGIDGAYVTGALSGFGSMSACAAGELSAAWISGGPIPGYARQLSLARYRDEDLMDELRTGPRGIL